MSVHEVVKAWKGAWTTLVNDNVRLNRVIDMRLSENANDANQGDTGSVVDLFCGVGGLTHGFKTEGFPIAAGIDIDEACRYAFEFNNDAPMIRRDVGSLTAKDLESLFVPGKHRILVGCAPCQPFSSYNQKNSNPKWQLLLRFAELIEDIQPDVVSMENVPRLLAFRGGETFDTFVGKLRDADYHVKWDVLYGPDYGLAQTRSRLVLLASKIGPINLPLPTHAERHRTVRDEIGGLPALSHGQVDDVDPLHRASGLSGLNASRIASSRPGGTWKEWDVDLLADCHRAKTGKGYSAVYGRMSWDAPSPTITTQFYGFGNGRFGHPDQSRALSLREGALLQGFPQDYEFVAPGNKIHFATVGRFVGNAVPVNLAGAIARSVKEHLRTLG